MKTKIVLSVLLLALLGGLAYFTLPARDGGGPAKKDPAKVPVPVSVAQAASRDMPVLLTVVGRGEAYESVTLRARVDGQVAAMPFTQGQHVRQGEVLVRLDPADFSARLQQAEANLARDEAQLAKAQADVARYLALRAQGFVSEEKVSELRATAQAMAATLRADQAAARLARLQLDYATLRAPFGGVVGAKLAFPGAVVKINETELAVINRVRPLYVSFAVPERHLPALRAAMARPAGLTAEVTLPGPAQPHSPSLAQPNTPGLAQPNTLGLAQPRFAGQVRFLDNAVDSATGTIQMKATLANEQGLLLPGQFVNVTLTLDVLRAAVVVPVEAVQQGPEGAFLFVVRPDQGVVQRPVRVSSNQQGLAIIAQGLAVGETVVTDGQLRLTPKSTVKIKPDAGAAAQAGRG